MKQYISPFQNDIMCDEKVSQNNVRKTPTTSIKMKKWMLQGEKRKSNFVLPQLPQVPIAQITPSPQDEKSNDT